MYELISERVSYSALANLVDDVGSALFDFVIYKLDKKGNVIQKLFIGTLSFTDPIVADAQRLVINMNTRGME